MVTNYMCEDCSKQDVCKRMDIICKFSEEAKKPLGVDITIDACDNYTPLTAIISER